MTPLVARTDAPPTRARQLRAPSATAAMLATIVLLAFPAAVTLAFVPRFAAIFRDLGVELPNLSRMFIRVGTLLSTPAGLAATGVYVLLAVLLSSAASRRPALASALLLLALALAVSYVLLFVLGMYLPMTAVLDSLRSGGRH